MSRTLAIAMAFALLPGCAGLDFDAAPEPLPTGRIALVAAGYAPEIRFEQAPLTSPTPGRHVAGSAAIGALMPLRVGAALGPLGLAVGVYLAPVGAAIGGLVGAISAADLPPVPDAMPDQKREAMLERLGRVVAQERVQEKMALRLAALGAKTHSLAYVSQLGPTGAGHRPDYANLKGEGFDAVIELRVSEVFLFADRGEPHSTAFKMKVEARIVPLQGGRDRTLEHTHTGTWESPEKWAAHDPAFFETEFDQAYGSLAESMSEDLFAPPVVAPSQDEPVAFKWGRTPFS
jgi:hypothetical protein